MGYQRMGKWWVHVDFFSCLLCYEKDEIETHLMADFSKQGLWFDHSGDPLIAKEMLPVYIIKQVGINSKRQQD